MCISIGMLQLISDLSKSQLACRGADVHADWDGSTSSGLSEMSG